MLFVDFVKKKKTLCSAMKSITFVQKVKFSWHCKSLHRVFKFGSKLPLAYKN